MPKAAVGSDIVAAGSSKPYHLKPLEHAPVVGAAGVPLRVGEMRLLPFHKSVASQRTATRNPGFLKGGPGQPVSG